MELKEELDNLKESSGLPIYSKVTFKGWDCAENFNNDTHQFFMCAAQFRKELNSVLKESKENSLSPQDKRNAIKKWSEIFPEKNILSELNEMQKNYISFETNHNIVKIPILIKKLNFYALLSKELQDDEAEVLDFVFFLALYEIDYMVKIWGEVKLNGLNFLKRNISLAKEINNEKGIFYGIAGKNHLRKNVQLEIKAVEKLFEILNEKKYVILFPTKNRINITYVESFFESSLLKKIETFSNKLFSERLNPMKNPKTWIVMATIPYFAFPFENYLLISCIGISLILGICAMETYDESIHKKDKSNYDEQAKHITKSFKTNQYLELKVSTIPHEVSFKLETLFLNYLIILNDNPKLLPSQCLATALTEIISLVSSSDDSSNDNQDNLSVADMVCQ